MSSRAILFAALAAALSAPLAAHAQFEGDLVLLPDGCQASGQCTLKNKLRFTDSFHVTWEAAAGLVTDGASIPGVFQPLVGKPFEQDFIKAAVIHDHYCDRHVRPWRQTHRVFYEGLINQGVSKVKAKVMYFAVYLGGPKWVHLIPGVKCAGDCINFFKRPGQELAIRSRAADYSAPDIPAELTKLQTELEADPDHLSLDDLDKRAVALRPNDYYYKNGADVVVEGGLATE
jgi:hypothetical protein